MDRTVVDLITRRFLIGFRSICYRSVSNQSMELTRTPLPHDGIIGDGSYADVFRFNIPTHPSACALKVPHPDLISRSILEKEERLLDRLHSFHPPHPALLLHTGRIDADDQLVGLVFPLAQYTLSEAMNRPDLHAVDDLLSGLAPICDGLQWLHAHTLIHGDVSPHNIMYYHDQWVLIDFASCTLPSDDLQLVTCTIPLLSRTTLPTLLITAQNAISCLLSTQFKHRPHPDMDEYALAIIAAQIADPNAVGDTGYSQAIMDDFKMNCPDQLIPFIKWVGFAQRAIHNTRLQDQSLSFLSSLGVCLGKEKKTLEALQNNQAERPTKKRMRTDTAPCLDPTKERP